MKTRILAPAVAVALALSMFSACSPAAPEPGGSAPAGSSAASADKPYAGTTLTYWATNQGSSIDDDVAILTPELAKFEEQTGIKVDLEVISWADMTNNTLQAAISGQGPDVINIGNTNATTFEATGAFMPFGPAEIEALGGADKWVPNAWATSGPEGKDPTSVPLYSQLYGLFYNKALFEKAGLQPPTTWEELVAAAKAITNKDEGTWGVVLPAGTVNVNMHLQYILAQQNGGSPFLADGTPDFTNDASFQAVKRYIDLMATEKVVNPSAVQYTDGTQATVDFAHGKVGMYMAQTGNVNALQQNGMEPDKYGVVPIPSLTGGAKVGSFIAGTNISIFNFTEHKEASLELVKFLTSPEEQEILNKAFRMISPVQGVPASAFEEYPDLAAVWPKILQDYAVPMAMVATVSAYQTNVGGGMVDLFSKAATGAAVTDDDIMTMLEQAEQAMANG